MIKLGYKMKTILICIVCMLLLAQTVLADDHVYLSIAETDEEIHLTAKYDTQNLNVLTTGILMTDIDTLLDMDTPGRKRITFTSLNEESECSLDVPNNSGMQSTIFRAYLIALDQNGTENIYYSSQYTPEEYRENCTSFISGNIIYNKIDNGLEVIGVVSQVFELEIPEYVNDQKVIRIADRAFEGDSVLVSIDLPDTIQTIGRRAFAGCTSLKNMR